MRESVIPAPQVRWHAAIDASSWNVPLYAADGRLYGADLTTTFARDAVTGRMLWESDFSGSLDAVGEHVAYQADFQCVRAVDLRDGAELWFRDLSKDRLKAPREVVRGPVRLPRRNESRYVDALHETADGTLVVQCGGAVFALDRATGGLRWGRRHGHWSTYAAVPDRAGPVLFFRRYPVKVVALDPGTGETVWKGEYQPLGRQGERLLVAEGRDRALDVVDGAGGRLTRHTFASPPTDYVGTFDRIRIAMTSEHVLVASGASGRPSWAAPTRLPHTAEGVTTCLVDGVVYVWDHLGVTRAFDAADGTLRWSGDSPWQGLSGRRGSRVRVTVDEDVVVLTADGGHVAVLDRGDGCPLWAWVDPDSSPQTPPPRVAVDRTGVYVVTEDRLLAFETPRHEPHHERVSAEERAAPRRRVVGMEPALRRTHRLTADPRLRGKARS